jgi:hypothetical protein
MESFRDAVVGPARQCGNTLHPPWSENELCSIVEAGGGKYVGVWKGIPGKIESGVLFISPQTRTTLGIPISRLTVEAVRRQLAKSNAAFNKNGRNDKRITVVDWSWRISYFDKAKGAEF